MSTLSLQILAFSKMLISKLQRIINHGACLKRRIVQINDLFLYICTHFEYMKVVQFEHLFHIIMTRITKINADIAVLIAFPKYMDSHIFMNQVMDYIYLSNQFQKKVHLHFQQKCDFALNKTASTTPRILLNDDVFQILMSYLIQYPPTSPLIHFQQKFDNERTEIYHSAAQLFDA